MEKKIRYTLGKTERLKSRKEIDHLFKEGKTVTVFPFRVLHLLKDAMPPSGNQQLPIIHPNLKAGFTVSSRNFKKAVDRNRIKRLMREAYRLQKSELQLLPEFNKNTLSLFFIYVGKEVPDYELVYEKTGQTIKKLIKFYREKG